MGILNFNLIHNNAPPSPATLTVPSAVVGGRSYTITWSSVVDPEEQPVTYVLECLYSGGSWTQLYSGVGTSHTLTVAYGEASVQWRVKAVDVYGKPSVYNTSASQTILNPINISSLANGQKVKLGGLKWIIVDKNHYSNNQVTLASYDSVGQCAFTYATHGSDGTTEGDWPSSYIRYNGSALDTFCNNLYNNLTSDKDRVLDTSIPVSQSYNNSTPTNLTRKFFMPSNQEMGLTPTENYFTASGSALSYFSSDANRIMKSGSSAVNYYTRTSNYASSANWKYRYAQRYVTTAGKLSQHYGNLNDHVRLICNVSGTEQVTMAVDSDDCHTFV